MKLKRSYLFLVSIFIFVLFANVVVTNAMNTRFSTEELSKNDQNTFASNIDILPLTVEPPKRGIQCFDVNEQGMIVVGQKGTHGKEICIYSSDGTFLYGYTFNCTGSFGVEWDEENLNICFVRSSVIVSVTPKGEISDISEVKNTIENNSHMNDLLYSNSRIVGGTKYLIKNDMGILNLFASSYSQLIVKDSTGAESIIYDVSSMQLSNMIVTISIVCVFVSVAIAAITWQFIKLRRGKQSEDSN